MWLRVRILKSLVFSLSTTVRALRVSLCDAAHVCSASLRIIGSMSVNGRSRSKVKEAATADLLGRIVRARSRIGTLRESRADAPKLLENEQKTVASCLAERRTLEQQIGELGKQLENLPTKEIAEREKTHQELVRRARRVSEEIGAFNHTISQLERLKKEAQTQHDELAGTSAKTRRLMMRRALADRGAELLEMLLHQHEIDARETIAAIINKILETTARREYRFAFRDNFAMELLFPDGRSPRAAVAKIS